ncbi:WG repeat-containing protein [Aridibaculum aurantiacum]|uniref:WG repeat-containing protein n=1 Tax=Aridibaculum aurantiacum TaxID=2810307 RepID=UPI001A95C5A5|nr:WG repeat-containing protein [Aridibaculum aurantiacum]
MKLYCLLILFLLISSTGICQFIPYHKKGVWGIVNEQKQTVLPFQYDETELFGKGGAKVLLGYKGPLLTIADTTGRTILVIPHNFDTARRKLQLTRSWERLSTLVIKGKLHILLWNKSGKQLVDENGKPVQLNDKYDDLEIIDNAVIVKLNGRYGLLDSTLQPVLATKYADFDYDRHFLVARAPLTKPVILRRGNWQKLSCDVSADHIWSVKNHGYLPYSKDGFVGLKDSSCNVLIPPRYSDIIVREDVIAGKRPNKNEDLFDLDAKLVAENVKHYVRQKDHYIIQFNRKASFYSHAFRHILTVPYDEVHLVAEPHYTGDYWVYHDRRTPGTKWYRVRKGNRWGVIDSTGKLIYPMVKNEYDAIFEDHAVIGFHKERSVYRFIEKQWDTVKIVYRDGRFHNIIMPGTAYGLPVKNRQAFLKDNHVGFVDFSGTQVIPPIFDRDKSVRTYAGLLDKYVSFIPWKEHTWIMYNKKAVLIDTSGMTIEPTSDEWIVSHQLEDGKKIIQFLTGGNDRYAIISADSTILVRSDMISPVFSKFIAVRQNSKYALFDKKGKQLTGYAYDSITIDDNLQLLQVYKNGRKGYMSLELEEYFADE